MLHLPSRLTYRDHRPQLSRRERYPRTTYTCPRQRRSADGSASGTAAGSAGVLGGGSGDGRGNDRAPRRWDVRLSDLLLVEDSELTVGGVVRWSWSVAGVGCGSLRLWRGASWQLCVSPGRLVAAVHPLAVLCGSCASLSGASWHLCIFQRCFVAAVHLSMVLRRSCASLRGGLGQLGISVCSHHGVLH